jgi:hypothetical protein
MFDVTLGHHPEPLLMSFNFRHNFISFSDFGPSQLSYIDAQFLMQGTKSQVNAYLNCYFTKVLTFYYDLLVSTIFNYQKGIKLVIMKKPLRKNY